MALFSTDQLKGIARQYAAQYGIDADVFVAQIGQESSWNPSAVNGNAFGLGQFMPATAAELGLTDRSDPIASLKAAAQYDAKLLSNSGGDYLAMLEHYGTLSGDSTNKVGPGSQVFGNFAQLLSAKGLDVPQVTDQGQTGSQVSFGAGDNGPIAQLKSWLGGNIAVIIAVIIGVLLVAGGIYGLVTRR